MVTEIISQSKYYCTPPKSLKVIGPIDYFLFTFLYPGSSCYAIHKIQVLYMYD